MYSPTNETIVPVTDTETVRKDADPLAGYSSKEETFPPVRGKVTLLVDGKAAFDAILKKMDELRAGDYVFIAVWHIEMETILNGVTAKGKVVKITIENLIKQLGEKGIQVRVLISLLDGFIVSPKGKKPFQIGWPDIKGKVNESDKQKKLSSYKNVMALVQRHPHQLRFGTDSLSPGCYHEKVVIVNGKFAFCGGLEFASLYTESDPSHLKSNRHDVHSLCEGPVVAQFDTHFRTRWIEAGGKAADLPPVFSTYDKSLTDHVVQVAITKSLPLPTILGGEDFETVNDKIATAYLDAIASAKKYIYIENQYFRDEKISDALIKAYQANKNLSIIILLPQRMEEERDNLFNLHAEFIQAQQIARVLSSTDRNQVNFFSLQQNRKEIYVHAKIMVIDDNWCTIGSANLNPRSMALDNEVNILIRDDIFAAALRNILWKEHISPDKKVIPLLSLDHASSFTKTWNKLAAEHPPKCRVILHKPLPGKELTQKILKDMIGDALNLKGLKRIVIPNIELHLYVGEFRESNAG